MCTLWRLCYRELAPSLAPMHSLGREALTRLVEHHETAPPVDLQERLKWPVKGIHKKGRPI